jgi:hypothetical protein
MDQRELVANTIRHIQEEMRRYPGTGYFAIFHLDDEKNYYVQFSLTDDKAVIWAEAVSNEYLEPKHALSVEKINKLEALGWKSPDEGGSPNFYREWQANTEEDISKISYIAAKTFNEIYGVSPDHSIKVEIVQD